MHLLSVGHVGEDQHDRVWAIIPKARQNKYSNRAMLALFASFIFLLKPSTHLFLKHTHTHVWRTSMLSNSCWPYFHMIKHDPLYQMQLLSEAKRLENIMRDHPPTQRLQVSPLMCPIVIILHEFCEYHLSLLLFLPWLVSSTNVDEVRSC